MQELTLGTLIAVFEEIFGTTLFWSMVVFGVLVAVAFIYILIRDRGISSSRLVRAELVAPVGAVGAVLFVQYMTSSGFSDIGGPIDVIVLVVIAVAGFLGLMILTYVIESLLYRRALK